MSEAVIPDGLLLEAAVSQASDDHILADGAVRPGPGEAAQVAAGIRAQAALFLDHAPGRGLAPVHERTPGRQLRMIPEDSPSADDVPHLRALAVDRDRQELRLHGELALHVLHRRAADGAVDIVLHDAGALANECAAQSVHPELDEGGHVALRLEELGSDDAPDLERRVPRPNVHADVLFLAATPLPFLIGTDGVGIVRHPAVPGEHPRLVGLLDELAADRALIGRAAADAVDIPPNAGQLHAGRVSERGPLLHDGEALEIRAAGDLLTPLRSREQIAAFVHEHV